MKLKFYFIVVLSFVSIYVTGTDFNILDFGAVPNQLSTTAIQKAIDTCHSRGGGRVIIPAGTFITGSLFLRSNVDLHLSPGAVLESSLNLVDFRINNRTYGMIYCEEATRVAITGSGTIHARGIDYPIQPGAVKDEKRKRNHGLWWKL